MKAIEELEICASRISRRIQKENESILAIRDQLIKSLQHPSTNAFSITCDVEVAHKRMQAAFAEIEALSRELSAYNEAISIITDCA